MQAELWLPMKISFTANLSPTPLSPVIYIFYSGMYASIQLRSRNCGVESIQVRSVENEEETISTGMEAHRQQTLWQIHKQQASEELPFCM